MSRCALVFRLELDVLPGKAVTPVLACAQDDWEPSKELTAAGICQVIGDDMLVTNPKRIQKAIDGKVVNALLLKVNQIGTITESIEAVRMAKAAGWGVLTSHRCEFRRNFQIEWGQALTSQSEMVKKGLKTLAATYRSTLFPPEQVRGD